MILLVLPLFLLLSCPLPARAFDYDFEGRVKADGAHVFNSPPGYDDFDRQAELRLGVLGNALQRDGWKLDYEVTGDVLHVGGPRVQAGLNDEFKAEFFRAWLRLDRDNFKVRGGRQKILFGSGTIFRPLGFFDTRDVSGIVPETKGVDGVRSTWFFDETTLMEGWAVPARKGDRVVWGLRGEGLIGGLETGAVFQYHPKTELSDLPNFASELYQMGYHVKGEYAIGYWNESRLDVESQPGRNPLRFDTVFGADYTFSLGQGLHVAAEYFVSAREKEISISPELQPFVVEHRAVHQVGVSFDQPVGIDIVWKVFGFYDVRDGSMQIVPQIEYAVTNQAFLYLHGRWGTNVNGEDNSGRFFLKGSAFNGTEPELGAALVVYF